MQRWVSGSAHGVLHTLVQCLVFQSRSIGHLVWLRDILGGTNHQVICVDCPSDLVRRNVLNNRRYDVLYASVSLACGLTSLDYVGDYMLIVRNTWS